MCASLHVLKVNCQSCSPKHALTLRQAICAFAITVVFCPDPCCRLICPQARTGHTKFGSPTSWETGPLLLKGDSLLGHRTGADR